MRLNIIVLLLVTLVWGTTFPLLRAAVAHLSGAEVSALRFLISGACMLPFALRAPRQTWRDGALLGVVALASYITQAFGLEYISSNRSAFITSLNVLMVPFLGLAFGGRLSLQTLSAACLACLGIGLMSWEGGSNWLGDVATLVCALAYALYVILLSRVAARHAPRQLAATQIVMMALISGAWLLVRQFIDPQSASTLVQRASAVWPSLVYLGLIAGAAMLFLQAWAQRSVSAEKAAVIYAMEPVFAAIFGWLLLHESMGTRGLAGGAMVVAAVVLGEWQFTSRRATG